VLVETSVTDLLPALDRAGVDAEGWHAEEQPMTQNSTSHSSRLSVSGRAGQHDHRLPTLPWHRECLALFTGKWPAGYRPRWQRTPWWHLATMLLSLVGSVTASSVIITGSWALWPLLALSWMFTVHSARKAQLVIAHYAVHANMTGQQWYDRVLVEVLSTLLIIQDYEGYYEDHVRTHHGLRLATLADPDVQFLLCLGFRPAMSRPALWRQLYWTMGAPRFQTLMLRLRLRSNFVSSPLYRRVMSGMYAAGVVLALLYTQAWLVFVVAWVVPIFPLYAIAALLQFVSEHRWLQGDLPITTPANKLRLGRLTFGRFVGDPLPSGALPWGKWIKAWGRWGTRLCVLHLPTRLCVLPGDLSQHDYHHRHPHHGDWSNAAYARQLDLAAGCPGWPEVYEEIWGLDKAIDLVFAGLASLPPLPEPLTLAQDVADVALGL
jgi:hypothetical protein